MKILAPNIRHGGADRLPAIIRFVRLHRPNVIVLTECRVGSTTKPFAD